jgi:hypothetical protein
MLNMRGRHRHKWDALKAALNDSVVYDDAHSRMWLPVDGSGQGLVFHAKQAQVGGVGARGCCAVLCCAVLCCAVLCCWQCTVSARAALPPARRLIHCAVLLTPHTHNTRTQHTHAQPVIHVFAIDVSGPALASGATAATCQCIEQVLDCLQGE